MLNHVYKFEVQYEDVDICDVVYHPNYIKFCDRARNDTYKNFGYGFSDQYLDKVGFAIVNINCNFLKTIGYAEEMQVNTTLKKVGKRTIHFSHSISSRFDSIDIRFEAEYVLVFVCLEQKKSIDFNDKVLRMLKNIEEHYAN